MVPLDPFLSLFTAVCALVTAAWSTFCCATSCAFAVVSDAWAALIVDCVLACV